MSKLEVAIARGVVAVSHRLGALCSKEIFLTDYAFSCAHGQAPRLLNLKYTHLIVTRNSFQNTLWDETSKSKLLFKQHIPPHTITQLETLETTKSEEILEHSTPHVKLIELSSPFNRLAGLTFCICIRFKNKTVSAGL